MFDQIYISQMGDLFMSVLYYIFDVETEDICLLGAGYERFMKIKPKTLMELSRCIKLKS